jgi:hypothetical protein
MALSGEAPVLVKRIFDEKRRLFNHLFLRGFYEGSRVVMLLQKDLFYTLNAY